METHTYEALRSEARALGERNDCAVKALAVALGVGYATAHAALARAGRKPGRSTPTWMTDAAARSLGFLLVDHKSAVKRRLGVRSKNMTVRQLSQRPDILKAFGPCLIRVRGHIMGARDGVIHDWADGRGFYVNAVLVPEPIR